MNIVVVEDSDQVYDNFVRLLATRPGYQIVGRARHEDEAVELIRTAQPDVALVDLGLESGSGLNVVRRLRAEGNGVRLLVLTNQPEALYKNASLEAGANGYFDKTEGLDALFKRLAAWQPPVGANEAERLRALHGLHILDTPPEAVFDNLAQTAAKLTGVPMALVSLVDADRQWFKARVGIEAQESSRALSFCAHAIQGKELMEVEDAALDSRFSDHPLVAGKPGIRFYAGMPLTLPGGESVGTLCVIDTVPRQLDAGQRDALAVLAHSVITEMELRRQVGELEAEVHRRIEAEMRIMHLATRDPLTGLPNRAALMDRLALALRGAVREQNELGVMFMDLDRFKLINDTLGHDIGDALLQRVAERLVRVLRDSDTVARLGGDEFAFILPLKNGPEDARRVADKLIKAVQMPVHLNGRTVQVGCSIGMALHPLHGSTEESLLRHADLAMYQAKTQGGNRYCEYAEHMDANAVERMTLESELRQAIDAGELELYYQPQVALRDGGLIGLEALVRWNHPRLGLLAPDRFIPLAEESGLIWPLGLYVLDRALAQLADWRARGFTLPRIAVNVSPAQLRETLLDSVIDALRVHDVPPRLLELELTESAITSDGPAVLELLHRLRDLGLGIAIDDFGVGYSSLALLRRLPIDTLKIDRSFVAEVASNPQDVAIVEAILTMARSMSLRTIAEGVEVEPQHVALRVLGCEYAQGFHYDKPMPVAQAETWLTRNPVQRHLQVV